MENIHLTYSFDKYFEGLSSRAFIKYKFDVDPTSGST